MAFGPGKYDAACTRAREDTRADGVVLIVLGGNQGSGFSVQASIVLTAALPGVLRQLADEIEKDAKGSTA